MTEWIWPLFGIAGTLLIALKIKYGWLCYIVSNTAAIIFLITNKTYVPLTQYGVYMVLNFIGIYKWFIKNGGVK